MRNYLLLGGSVLAIVLVAFAGIAFGASASSAPTNVTATFFPPGRVQIKWNAPVNATSVVGYYVYRNGGLAGETRDLSYQDAVYYPGSYAYAVAGYTSSSAVLSMSAVSAPVTVFTDTTPPSAPSELMYTALTSSSVTLSWKPATDVVGLAGYYIIKSGSRVYTPNPITGTTYTDVALAPEATYPYRVVAYDASGNVSDPSNVLQVRTLSALTKISPAFNPRAITLSTTSIALAWGAATDDFGTPAYYIYRDGLLVTSSKALSYEDRGLKPGTSYSYYLISFDAAGNLSARSDSFGTSTFAGPPVVDVPTYVPLPGVPQLQVVATPATAITANVPVGGLTGTLSLGMNSSVVLTLQKILAAQGYLGTRFITGSFGVMTQEALKQFQCDQNIVCSGSPASTGWGMMGAKTRAALNAL